MNRRLFISGGSVSLLAMACLLIPTLASDALIVAAQDKQDLIEIGKETTRITEPIDDAGYVDYLEAINKMRSEGVTAANNFEVICREVFGAKTITPAIRNDYYTRLGVPVPTDETTPYQAFVTYVLNGATDEAQRQRAYDMEDTVRDQPWTRQQQPKATEWVARYGPVMDRLVEGSKRARFYTPYLVGEEDEDEPFPRLITVLLPSAQQQREIARALTIRAMGRIGEGDLTGAWNDAQAMRRVARHVAGGVTLIESLVGIAIDSMAFSVETRILNAPGLTDKQTDSFLADIAARPPLSAMADKIDIGERFMGLDATVTVARHGHAQGLFKMLKMIQQLSDADGAGENSLLADEQLFAMVTTDVSLCDPSEQAIDWNATMKLLNGWYDRLTAACREPDFDKRQAALQKVEQDLKEVAGEFKDHQKLLQEITAKGIGNGTGEAVGKILISLLLPAITTARKAEDRALAQQAVIYAGFAVERHRRQSGSYPATLKAIATDVPVIDPCSGKPLKFSADARGFTLYSVGRNGVDDRGRTWSDAARMEGQRPQWDDILVRVRRER